MSIAKSGSTGGGRSIAICGAGIESHGFADDLTGVEFINVGDGAFVDFGTRKGFGARTDYGARTNSGVVRSAGDVKTSRAETSGAFEIMPELGGAAVYWVTIIDILGDSFTGFSPAGGFFLTAGDVAPVSIDFGNLRGALIFVELIDGIDGFVGIDVFCIGEAGIVGPGGTVSAGAPIHFGVAVDVADGDGMRSARTAFDRFVGHVTGKRVAVGVDGFDS